MGATLWFKGGIRVEIGLGCNIPFFPHIMLHVGGEVQRCEKGADKRWRRRVMKDKEANSFYLLGKLACMFNSRVPAFYLA